jgi:5'-nucleotidase
MRILVTNDDGINAPGLKALIDELDTVATLLIVAPDREQSAIGTAVTLRQPLRIQNLSPFRNRIEAYAVEGTPADSVILALAKLAQDKIDLVISGINQGSNLGDDVLISGTVGAALQGYLRGIPTLALSLAAPNHCYRLYFENTARLARLLVAQFAAGEFKSNLFLNINTPNLPLAKIKGLKITRLAHETHIETVDEGHDGRRAFYWLRRQNVYTNPDPRTDIWAIKHDYISLVPLNRLFTPRTTPQLTEDWGAALFNHLKAV